MACLGVSLIVVDFESLVELILEELNFIFYLACLGADNCLPWWAFKPPKSSRVESSLGEPNFNLLSYGV